MIDVHAHSEHVLCTGIEHQRNKEWATNNKGGAGVARLRDQQRERWARARAEETVEQREQREQVRGSIRKISSPALATHL